MVNKMPEELAKINEELTNNVIEYKKKTPDFFNENNTFLHYEMAAYLIDEYKIIILDKQIYYYDGKKHVNDESKIKTLMTELVASIKENQRNEVLHTIRYTAPEREHAPARYIGVLNGVYDIEDNRFIEGNHNLIFTNLINAEYDPGAKCKEVDNLLDSISEGDEEIIKLLKEMIAYTIYRKNSLEKSFLLKGESGSGKSTILNTVAAFIGEENIASLSLQQLDEQFYTSLLHGKMANIGDDIGYGTIKDTSTFKKLSTGERVTGAFKNKDPFQFRSFAKLIFSANRLPRMNESSGAVVDRFVIIPLNARIRGTNKQDPNFEEKVTTDEARSYLLNIAIETLKELLKKGRFTIPHVVHEELEQFDIMNDPIKEWLSEYGERGKDLHEIPVDSAFQDYKNFCGDNGFKYPISKKKLTQELKSHGYTSKRIYIGGEQKRAYILADSIEI